MGRDGDRPMRDTAFVSHSDCARHDTGWEHPDHQGRLPALMRAVYADMLTLFDRLLEVEGRHASREELELVHSAEYLSLVESWVVAATQAGEVIEPVAGLRISDASMDAARAAVGAPLTAVDRILAGEVRQAFCPVRPPGRYVTGDASGGFGVFNSVVTCARYLDRQIRRSIDGAASGPFILELCGPAGTPTAGLVAKDGFRVDGVYRSVDGGLPAGQHERFLGSGAGSAAFMDALDDLLSRAAGERFPAVILSIGFDGLAGDPLGDLGLQPEDYYAVTMRVRRFADEFCGGRIISILEGGYDSKGLGRATVQHLRALVGVDSVD